MKTLSLTQGKVAFVDDEDYELASRFKWHTSSRPTTTYAVCRMSIGTYRNGRQPKVGMYLHQLITRPPQGMEVDHKDGNGLNCCRNNMRVATGAQNQHNRRKQKGTSRFKGVCWRKAEHKWQAQIKVGEKRLYLGRFSSEIEAAKAYDMASIRYFGDFAWLNFKKTG